MNTQIFKRTDILLPCDRTAETMERWSVVACDQYTSEPEYWSAVAQNVGDAPSALHMIYPELYLSEAEAEKEQRIRNIGATMHQYHHGILTPFHNTMIYVERTMKNGTIRHGIVGAFDLEAYSYDKGAQSPIRATEGTVLSRIPPRVRIRKDAPLESPHVMILADDRENKLIRTAAQVKANSAPVYDFDLMQGGGHITGWVLPEPLCGSVEALADALGDTDIFAERYKTDAQPLVFAVGDGNHSLATAKACYEALKADIGAEAALKHPARYALAELVNLYDDALVFEPIYRVVFGLTADAFLSAMHTYYPDAIVTAGGDIQNIPETEHAHTFLVTAQKKTYTVTVPAPTAQLPVGTLQTFLDAYLAEHPAVTVDYIHGVTSTAALSEKDGAVGILFCGMEKEALYRTVIFDGALPRKTFSMGEADEKRYYLECRAIR